MSDDISVLDLANDIMKDWDNSNSEVELDKPLSVNSEEKVIKKKLPKYKDNTDSETNFVKKNMYLNLDDFQKQSNNEKVDITKIPIQSVLKRKKYDYMDPEKIKKVKKIHRVTLLDTCLPSQLDEEEKNEYMNESGRYSPGQEYFESMKRDDKEIPENNVKPKFDPKIHQILLDNGLKKDQKSKLKKALFETKHYLMKEYENKKK